MSPVRTLWVSLPTPHSFIALGNDSGSINQNDSYKMLLIPLCLKFLLPFKIFISNLEALSISTMPASVSFCSPNQAPLSLDPDLFGTF